MTNKVKYEHNYKPCHMVQWPVSNTYSSIKTESCLGIIINSDKNTLLTKLKDTGHGILSPSYKALNVYHLILTATHYLTKQLCIGLFLMFFA